MCAQEGFTVGEDYACPGNRASHAVKGAKALRGPTLPLCRKNHPYIHNQKDTSLEAKTHRSKRTAYEEPHVEAATIPAIIIPAYEIDAPLAREGQPSLLEFSRRNDDMYARCEYAAEHHRVSRC